MKYIVAALALLLAGCEYDDTATLERYTGAVNVMVSCEDYPSGLYVIHFEARSDERDERQDSERFLLWCE